MRPQKPSKRIGKEKLSSAFSAKTSDDPTLIAAHVLPLDFPLIMLGPDTVTTKDAIGGIMVPGSPGAGKTSGSSASDKRVRKAFGEAVAETLASADAKPKGKRARPTGKLDDIIPSTERSPTKK